jgi:lipopolysaccharide/colanic/teichoic acid biosynthesis glycosyltransferase
MRCATFTIRSIWSPLDQGIKRAFDLVCSGIGVIMFAPIILAISTAIKLANQGPIFFRQTRYGYDNQIVQVLEFRSITTEDMNRHGLRMTLFGQVLHRTGIK